MLHSTSSSEGGNSGCVISLIIATVVFSCHHFHSQLLTGYLPVWQKWQLSWWVARCPGNQLSEAQLQVQSSVFSKILYMTKSLYCIFLFLVIVTGMHYKGVHSMLAVGKFSFTYKQPFKVSSFPLTTPDEYSSQNCHFNPLLSALPHAGKFCSHI